MPDTPAAELVLNDRVGRMLCRCRNLRDGLVPDGEANAAGDHAALPSERPANVRDLFRDSLPPIRDFCPALSGFRSRWRERLASKNLCISRGLRATIRVRSGAPPRSGSSDAPELPGRFRARSWRRPPAYVR